MSQPATSPQPPMTHEGSATGVLVSQERAYSLSVKEGWFEMVNTPDREQPVAKTIKQLAAMSEAERLQYNELRAVWHANLGPIDTPQLIQVHEDLWEIVDSNRQDGDKVKGAASIDAHPGLGKTTIAVAFARDFHREQLELYGPKYSATSPRGRAMVDRRQADQTGAVTGRSRTSLGPCRRRRRDDHGGSHGLRVGSTSIACPEGTERFVWADSETDVDLLGRLPRRRAGGGVDRAEAAAADRRRAWRLGIREEQPDADRPGGTGSRRHYGRVGALFLPTTS